MGAVQVWLVNWHNWSAIDWAIAIGAVCAILGFTISTRRPPHSETRRIGDVARTTHYRGYEPAAAIRRLGWKIVAVGFVLAALGLLLKR
jgi:hypothetical protein